MAISTFTPSAAENSLAIKQVWENIDARSCPSLYNFHMHTVYSDGRLTPEELIQQALHIGLRGMAITDHHCVNGYQAAIQWLKRAETEKSSAVFPHLWTGIEITAKLLNTEVHILGYAFAIEHPALEIYLQGKAPQGKEAEAKQVIKAIHQAGGLAVLAHPARYRRSAEELIPAIANLGIDGLEAYYAYGNPSPWQPSPKETKLVLKFARTYGLFNTCGTDTHGLNLLQRI